MTPSNTDSGFYNGKLVHKTDPKEKAKKYVDTTEQELSESQKDPLLPESIDQ